MRGLIRAMGSSDEAKAVQAATELSCLLKDERDPRWSEAVQAVAAEQAKVARLLVSDNPQLQGCAISILRRVPPDAATVALLLELLDDPRHAEARSVIANALGECEDEAWSDEVERALAVCLLDPDACYVAARMLHERHLQLRSEVTLRTLAATALRADALTARTAVLILGRSVSGPLSAAAAPLVEALRPKLSPPLRAHLEEVLSWARRA